MSEVVAVIPARGGSKGVSRKNVRRVGGIPLIGRAIAAARAAERIDRVLVSTDDPEIAATAAEWGAEVIDRPAELSGDTASSEAALLHALDTLQRRGVDVGVLAFLQATSPFIDPGDLDTAVALVHDGSHDSVFSATETYGFLWVPGADGAASGVNHDAAHRPRRQDRDPHFLETGAIYVMDAAGFRAARHRFFGRIGLVEVAERTALEIDTEEQLALAQATAPLIDGASRGSALGAPPRGSSPLDASPHGGAIDVDAVVTDFDGVHTDDRVQVDAEGREHVRVSRADGMGVALLRRAGIPMLILSSETNPVVTARAKKLRVEVQQGVGQKAPVLRAWAEARGIPLSRIAYIGNDVNDLECLELVGWPVAVPDAHPLVLAAARTIVERPGGSGAVRDLADRVLRAHADRVAPTAPTPPPRAPARTERTQP